MYIQRYMQKVCYSLIDVLSVLEDDAKAGYSTLFLGIVLLSVNFAIANSLYKLYCNILKQMSVPIQLKQTT